MPQSNVDLEAIRPEAAERQHGETQRSGQAAVLWKSRLDVVLPPKDGEAGSDQVMQELSPPPWKDRKCK